MKNICILFFLFSPLITQAQTAEEVFENYKKAMRSWKSVSYRINNIDTFTNGKVWNKSGYAVLKKIDKAIPLPFMFKAKQDNSDHELIFDGEKLFSINHNAQTYHIEKEIDSRQVQGTPSGQMIFAEAFDEIERYQTLSLEKTDSTLILKIKFADTEDYAGRIIILHLDESTFFPVIRYFTQGSEQRYTRMTRLYDIIIDSYDVDSIIAKKDFLETYTYAPQEKTLRKHSFLMGKTAPDFKLKGVDNKLYQLSQKRDKTILLDFWDITCGPCIQSIREMKAIADKFPKGKFELLSIVTEQKTFSRIPTFVASQKINYPVLFADVASRDAYFVYGVPLYVLIDRDGIVRYIKSGSTSEIAAVVDTYVGKK